MIGKCFLQVCTYKPPPSHPPPSSHAAAYKHDELRKTVSTFLCFLRTIPDWGFLLWGWCTLIVTVPIIVCLYIDCKKPNFVQKL
jgi:hypothetical protein